MKQPTLEKTPNSKSLEFALREKQTQLNALLEVTLAINENLGAKGLWQKYENILSKKIGIDRVAIYSAESGWLCIQHSGVEDRFVKRNLRNELLSLRQITKLKKDKSPFAAYFDIAMPVFHKEEPLITVLLGKSDDEKFLQQEDKISFIQTITNIVVVAIENKKLMKEQLQQQAIKKELEFGGTMQTMLIPKKFPYNNRIQMAACYIPNLDVGGDYYDYIEPNDDEIIFCIGDISGKGVAAALLMANFQASFRMLAKSMNFLDEMVQELNNRVNEITQGEKFITLFVGRYNYFTRKLQYVNAGHTPPLLLHKNQVTQLTEGCTILGMFEKLPSIKTGKVTLEEEAFLFCFTDGLTDVENEQDQVIDMHLLEEILQKKSSMPVQEFNKLILDFVVEFKGNRLIGDDISFMSCKLL